MTLLSRVIGGALSGYGASLTAQAEERRKAALLALEHQYRTEEADTEYQRRGGMIQGTVTDDQGNVVGYSPTGKRIDLGIKAKPDKSSLQTLKVWDPQRKAYVYQEESQALGALAEDPNKPASTTRVPLKERLADYVSQGGTLSPKQREAYDLLTDTSKENTLERIRAKIATGETLTKGEQTLYEDSKRATNVLQQAIAGMLTGGRAGLSGGLLDEQTQGGAPAAPNTAPVVPSSRGMLPSGPIRSPTQDKKLLQDARDAIAQGAPREAVTARLRQMGIDPSGL